MSALEDLRGVIRIAKAASYGVTGNQPRIERAEKAITAVAGLVDKARRLADAVEFRIDDPRAALRDELRAAITAAGGAA